MKNIFLFLLISVNIFSRNTNENNCDLIKITWQQTVAEVYYNRLEVSSRLPIFVNRYIDRKAKERPEVSAAVWQNIKNSIDYSIFKNLVINILNNSFTNSEMQQTISQYKNKPYIPIVTLKLKNDLYLASAKNDDAVKSKINTILISNGYKGL